MKTSEDLLQKYSVAAPRYTSYPTVPYWDNSTFSNVGWRAAVSKAFAEDADGISVYIHLPYCESLCTYCGCNTRITKNHNVELPYIKAVLREWQMYKELSVEPLVIKEIHLGGGTPTFFSPENLEYLIMVLTAGVEIHPDAEFSFEAHPGNTTDEHLETLYKLGFKRLSLGIQDFDPLVQFTINRIQTFEQVAHVTAKAREIGYTSINFDLIYGLPRQQLKGLVETIEKVGLLMPDRIAFYSYAHVPWIKPGQRKFTEADLPGVAEKYLLYEMGRHLLNDLGYRDIGMDHFALTNDSLYQAAVDGRLHRNFMGYTHQYTKLLIGLGVSAISDIWNAYAQNVKTVEEYLQMVNEGELPVFKGHMLTNEDLVIRRHMLNIMCKGSTNWESSPCRIPALIEGIERMQELVDDCLIQLDANGTNVTLAGKRFLRNICMALDARLWADKPATQLFSMAG